MRSIGPWEPDSCALRALWGLTVPFEASDRLSHNPLILDESHRIFPLANGMHPSQRIAAAALKGSSDLLVDWYQLLKRLSFEPSISGSCAGPAITGTAG